MNGDGMHIVSFRDDRRAAGHSQRDSADDETETAPAQTVAEALPSPGCIVIEGRVRGINFIDDAPQSEEKGERRGFFGLRRGR